MLQTRIPGVRAPRFVRNAPTGSGQGSRVLLMMMLPFAIVLAGCRDGSSPTAPLQDDRHPTATAITAAEFPAALASPKAPTGPVTAADVIEDALERVLPALEAGGPTAAIEAGLRQLQTQLEGGKGGGLQRALTEVRKAVDGFQAGAGEAFQADTDVVQLALDAVARG